MKRFLLTLTVLMVSITAAFAAVYTGKCGTNVSWTLDTETGVLKIEGTGEMNNYTSSSSNRVPWSSNRSYVKEVQIAQGVTNIGWYAFEGCSSLTSITIPESVTSIGDSAFLGCTSLTSITIPEGVTSIGVYAFQNCSSLTSITIPESVTSIDGYAFQGCSSLTSITIPESVTSIGGGAFSYCSSLTSITIPSSVTSIGRWAFEGCSSLTSITIPEGVTSIGDDAFSGCYCLASNIKNNTSFNLANLGLTIYNGEQMVEQVDGLLIADNVAVFCRSWATSVNIPNSVTSIGPNAFKDCKLKSLTVGTGVISISSSAFSMKPIKTIWLTNTPPTGYEYANGTVNYVANDLYTKLSNTKKYPLLSSLFVVDGVKYALVSTSDRTCDAIDCAYDDTEHIKIGTNVTYKNVKLTVKNINEYALYQNNKIKNVDIENDGIVGDRAFYGCSGLQLATIANNGNIGNSAFYGCSGLQKAIVSNIGYIGESAFEESFKNPSDTSFVHIESTSDIQQKAFKNCSGIRTLEVMNGGAVGSNAFYGCSNLQSATIKNSGDIGTSAFQDAFKVATEESFVFIENQGNIGSNAFKTSSGLQTAHIKNTGIIGANAFEGAFSAEIGSSNVRIENGSYIDVSAFTSAGLKYAFINNKGDIKDKCFYSCANLDSVEINNSGKIGISAFDGWSKLRVALLGQTVTSLGNYAFRNCKMLEKTIIPDSVLSLGEYCFDGCTSLSYAKIGNGVSAIPPYAFRACGLKVVEIGSGVKTIALRAFSSCSSLPEINIPQNVTSIGNYVFAGCSKLSLVSIKDRTATLALGSNGSSPMFADCPLDSVYLGGKITYNTGSYYGYSPFYRNLSLRSIRITDVEDTIYDNEFYGCTGLQHVRIGDGVKTIGKWAFSGCSSLLFFSYGTSLQSIGQEAFSDCVGVTKLISNAATPPVCGSQALEDISKWECTLYVPAESIDDYQAADQWKDFFFMEEYNGENPLPTYALTFLVDGVSYAVVEYEEGSSITLPEPPTKEGYTFQGWEGLPEDMLMPSSDLTVTAIFEEDVPEDTDIAALADAVYARNQMGSIGSQMVLPIQMKNSIAATGFQADLVLPEGITVAEDEDGFPMVELSTQRTTATRTNMFDYSYQADGSLRIVCNSTKGIAFTGNDGEVALVTLNISEEIEEGDYPIIIKNIVITDAQGIDKKKVDLVKSTLTLVAYTLGDVNGDNEVDVADISSLSSYILGRVVPGFVEKAADLNEDTEIDVADISALAYLILHPETAQKAKVRKAAEKKENIENAYNTLYAEILQAEAGTDVVLPIMMRNSIEATGFQLDLVLPEGVTLKEAVLSNARTSSKRTNLFDYAHQADGTYRILCNSTKGLSFNGHDGEVMTLTLHIDKDAELGAQTIALKDMVLTDATGMLREESSLSESTLWVGNATGIHEMASEKSAPAYDLQGRQVSKKQKGIHIQNGKKTVVK